MEKAIQETGITTRREMLAAFLKGAAIAAPLGVGLGLALRDPDKNRTLSDHIRHITNQITTRRSATPSGKPLFVLMGEAHDQPSHKLVMQGVILNLRAQKYNIATGLEFPNGVVTDVMQAEDTPWVNDRILRSFCEVELNSGKTAYEDGDQGVKQFMKFLSAERIPMRYHDLNSYYCGRMKEKRTLYWEDKINLDYFKAANVVPSENISATERTGMRLRNMAMSDGAIAHAVETGAQIYIQHTGASHLVGDSAMKCPYDESLMAELRKKGQTVLAFDLTGAVTRVPEAGRLIEGGALIAVKGLPYRAFDYEGLTEEADYKLAGQELAYMSSLAQEAGLKIYHELPTQTAIKAIEEDKRKRTFYIGPEL